MTMDEAAILASRRCFSRRVAPESKGIMEWTFNEHGEYVSAFCQPEQGPLRPSSLTPEQKASLPPPWSMLDHVALPYTTTADHRSVEGRIIPRGSACLASRQHGVLTLCAQQPPLGTIVLDGSRWVLDIPEAPRLSPSECPELFLPA